MKNGQMPDRERLESLVEALEMTTRAVERAHARGWIHRDIKPANIIWSDDGSVKLGDWGHAGKLVDVSTLMDATSSIAMTSIHGTLPFISPERLKDRRVATVQVDIYSLGVSLYNILTGTLPFTGTESEQRQQIEQGMCPKPRELNSTSPRILEAICLKAMSLNPDDRYDSAAAFRVDLENWRMGKPVAIYDPLTTKLNRFAKRNFQVIAAAAAILLLAVIAISVERGRAIRSRNQALAAQDQTARIATVSLRAISDLLIEPSKGPDSFASLPNGQGVRNRLLTNAQSHIESLLTENHDLVPERLQAIANLRLAQLLFEMGEVATAQKNLDEATKKLKQQLLSTEDVAEITQDLASAYHLHSQIHLSLGNYDQATQNASTAIELRRNLQPSVGSQVFEGLLANYSLLGTVLQRQGQLSKSEQVFSELQNQLDRIPSTQRSSFVQELMATALQNRGAVAAQLGKKEEALRLFEECKTEQVKLVESFPWAPVGKKNLSMTLHNIGLRNVELHKPAEALPSFVEADLILGILVRENPSDSGTTADPLEQSVHAGVNPCHGWRPAASTAKARCAARRARREDK